MSAQTNPGAPHGVDYQELYRKSPAMLLTISGDGAIIAVSDAWLKELGYTPGEVIGANIRQFLVGKGRGPSTPDGLPFFFQIGFVKDLPFCLLKRNGDTLDILISTVSQCDDSGNYFLSMAVMTDITERKRVEEEHYQLAYYDQLTGKPNRFLLHERLNQSLAQGSRDGKKIAVLFLDLDRFKWVNDTLGHDAGDKLLKIVAKRLDECVRRVDTVARIGGDEFAIILHGISSEDDARIFAGRILEAIARPTVLNSSQFINSASIGIAIYPLDGQDGETLLRNADTAMYAAKNSGCNAYQFYSRQMAQREKEKLSMECSLRSALENREFFLHYQPQFDVMRRRVIGFEALLRWVHPTLGCISPTRFIPLAEETGLILPLGEWVLRTACRQAAEWHHRGMPPWRIAVNISARQLARPDFIEMVESILAETALPPERLEIELTETLVMDKVQDSISPLIDLKIRNVHLAIDDFGTGSSSLVYLKNFPFDRIKISQVFVRDLMHAHDSKAIVKAILEIGRSLNLDVLAEGVESQPQLDYLRQNHCHEIQGFYLGRPTSPHRIPSRYAGRAVH